MTDPVIGSRVARHYGQVRAWNPTHTFNYRMRTIFSPQTLVSIDWLKLGLCMRKLSLGMIGLWVVQESHTEEKIFRTQLE